MFLSTWKTFMACLMLHQIFYTYCSCLSACIYNKISNISFILGTVTIPTYNTTDRSWSLCGERQYFSLFVFCLLVKNAKWRNLTEYWVSWLLWGIWNYFLLLYQKKIPSALTLMSLVTVGICISSIQFRDSSDSFG